MTVRKIAKISIKLSFASFCPLSTSHCPLGPVHCPLFT